MSRFQSQNNAIGFALQKIERLAIAVEKIRVSAASILKHNHSDNNTGGLPEFTPATPSDWWGSGDPGDVWDALDQLAARLKAIEFPVTSGANTMLFEGME